MILRFFFPLMLVLGLLTHGELARAAPPQSAYVETLAALQKSDARVAAIAYRLATRGAPLCPLRQPLTGLTLHSLSQYVPSFRSAAVQLFGFDGLPQVLAVVPGSAAERAGLTANDKLFAVNRVAFVDTPGKQGSTDAVVAAQSALDAALSRPPAKVKIARPGASVAIDLAGVMGCKSRVELVPGGKLNAKADGEIVQLTTAVLAETRDDSELAFIIAHEMAHNVLGHPQMLRAQGRKASRVLATEIEADRLAIRLMNAAGYDTTAPARFWARFGKKTGSGIFSDGSHLRTKDRVRMLENEGRMLTQ
jgi:beta-barrel assembly-enhancing protease